VRRVTALVGQDVVGFDATVGRSEAHVVVVERGGSVVVDDVWTGERGSAGFLTLFPACDNAFAGFGGLVPSGLDKATVEAACLLSHVVVGFRRPS